MTCGTVAPDGCLTTTTTTTTTSTTTTTTTTRRTTTQRPTTERTTSYAPIITSPAKPDIPLPPGATVCGYDHQTGIITVCYPVTEAPSI